MEIFKILSRKSYFVKKEIRKLIRKNINRGANACVALNGVGDLEFIICESEESFVINALIYQHYKLKTDNDTYVAIAPKDSINSYENTGIVNILFVKKGKIVSYRTGSLKDDSVITYCIQQAMSEYNSRVIFLDGMNIDLVTNMSNSLEIELKFTPIIITTDSYSLYQKEEILQFKKKYRVTAYEKIIILIIFLSLCSLIFFTLFYEKKLEQTITYRVIDQYQSYHDIMTGTHVTESFSAALKEFDTFADHKGWSLVKINIKEDGSYTGFVSKQFAGVSVTPFLIWSRSHTKHRLEIYKEGFKYKDKYSHSNYIRDFGKYIVDVDLNVALLKDLGRMLDLSSFKILSTDRKGKYKIVYMKMVFNKTSMKILAEYYDLLSNIPLINTGLTIIKEKNNGYSIVQTMKLIGK